jgi:hypothetical protein
MNGISEIRPSTLEALAEREESHLCKEDGKESEYEKMS